MSNLIQHPGLTREEWQIKRDQSEPGSIDWIVAGRALASAEEPQPAPEPTSDRPPWLAEGEEFSEIGVAVVDGWQYFIGQNKVVFKQTTGAIWVCNAEFPYPCPTDLDAWHAILEKHPDATIEPRPGWGRVWKSNINGVIWRVAATRVGYTGAFCETTSGCALVSSRYESDSAAASQRLLDKHLYNAACTCIGFLKFDTIKPEPEPSQAERDVRRLHSRPLRLGAYEHQAPAGADTGQGKEWHLGVDARGRTG